MKESRIMNIDISESRVFLEQYIYRCMKININESTFDFMHAALGPGLYYLKENKSDPINELIEFLDSTAIKDENSYYKWASVDIDSNTNKIYNIALSHGCSSIALFLSRVISNEKIHVNKEKCISLLVGCINFILSQKFETKQLSVFPSQSLNKPTPSRLAWCYGDPGVAFAIYNAGKVINKKEWVNEGLRVLKESIKRKRVDETMIQDAGICHGTAGLAMIYRRMHLETQDQSFMEAANYWIEQTLAYSNHIDGIAGYKTCTRNGDENDFSLLSGVAGIGLVLLSYMCNDSQNWDELFLL